MSRVIRWSLAVLMACVAAEPALASLARGAADRRPVVSGDVRGSHDEQARLTEPSGLTRLVATCRGARDFSPRLTAARVGVVTPTVPRLVGRLDRIVPAVETDRAPVRGRAPPPSALL